MSAPFVRNEAYEKKVQEIVLDALMIGLMDPETRQCLWRVGEIINVMTTITAMLVADSPVTDSPTKTREFCVDWSKQLQRRISAAKRQYAAGHKPFKTINIEGELH